MSKIINPQLEDSDEFPISSVPVKVSLSKANFYDSIKNAENTKKYQAAYELTKPMTAERRQQLQGLEEQLWKRKYAKDVNAKIPNYGECLWILFGAWAVVIVTFFTNSYRSRVAASFGPTLNPGLSLIDVYPCSCLQVNWSRPYKTCRVTNTSVSVTCRNALRTVTSAWPAEDVSPSWRPYSNLWTCCPKPSKPRFVTWTTTLTLHLVVGNICQWPCKYRRLVQVACKCTTHVYYTDIIVLFLVNSNLDCEDIVGTGDNTELPELYLSATAQREKRKLYTYRCCSKDMCNKPTFPTILSKKKAITKNWVDWINPSIHMACY